MEKTKKLDSSTSSPQARTKARTTLDAALSNCSFLSVGMVICSDFSSQFTATAICYRQIMRCYVGRAASSIVLNLAEGRGSGTKADQKIFFHMALGSVRESQAILDISPEPSAEAVQLADVLAASVYCLIRSFPLRPAFPLRLALRQVLRGTSAAGATADRRGKCYVEPVRKDPVFEKLLFLR